MRVIRTFVILFALVWIGHAVADEALDDALCEVRPDLCGKPALKRGKAHKKKKKKTSTRQARRKRDCREPGQSFDASTADLPLCGQEAALAADEIEQDLKSAPPKRTRQPASFQPSITYESYLQENAKHPALHLRQNNQLAFQPTVYRAPSTTLNPAPPSISPSGGFGTSGDGTIPIPPSSAPAAAPPAASGSSGGGSGGEMASPAGAE